MLPTQHDATACPHCGETLLALTSDDSQRLLCPGCRQHFQLHTPAATPPPLAGASFVLGLASLLGNVYTGIPAVLLGVAALRIRGDARPSRRSRLLAWGGITSAVACSLIGWVLLGLIVAGQLSVAPLQHMLAQVIQPSYSVIPSTPKMTGGGNIFGSEVYTPVPIAVVGGDSVEEVVVGSPPAPADEPSPPRADTSGMTSLVDPQATWAWLHPTDGTDPATSVPNFHTSFYLLDFDDASWATHRDETGRGFGYGDPVGVPLGTPDAGKRYTAYFRCKFSAPENYDQLVLEFSCDDGVIVYLDGAEVARENVAGPEQYTTGADATVGGSDETRVRQFILPDPLPAGDHVLAISLHNRDPQSSTDLRLGDVALWGQRSQPSP